MRRLAPILFSILLGAIAVAGGMGSYLVKANDDRTRLATLANQAVQRADQAEQQSQQAITQADLKIQDAQAQVTASQATIATMQEQEQLLASATTLSPADPHTIKNWGEAADVPLGVSVQYPPSSIILANDEVSLSLATSNTQLSVDGQPYRWFEAVPYDPHLESSLLDQLNTTSSLLLLQKGRLLMGTSGVGADGHTVYVMHSSKAGQPDRLIWARDPQANRSDKYLLTSLATLDFAN